MSSEPTIVVVGSVNMDVVSVVEAFPQPGETVHARATSFHHGGKGANQAVAAAAAGASVDFIGAVGDDAFAEPLAAGLAARGVGVEALARKPTTSGQAFITVNAAGQNCIILSAGANGQVTAAQVEAQRARITQAGALLTQNEIPWEATFAAIRLAHQAGVRVIYNPAPAAEPSGEVYPLLDTLILNEIEAATLTRHAVATLADAAEAARELIGRGVREVIVTLGALGSLYLNADGRQVETPIFPVTVVDTTGAGDTFIGMYAVAATQMDAAEALRFASAASAICVTRPGAQESIPTRAEVEAFLQRQGAS
ncbi:MAG TPA: ribokinase [Ktedonobacterales bacterium]|nr:ribokinase [Ktedonobacterales bacterium]